MTEYAKTVFDCLYDCKMTVKGYTEQEIDGLTSMSGKRVIRGHSLQNFTNEQ